MKGRTAWELCTVDRTRGVDTIGAHRDRAIWRLAKCVVIILDERLEMINEPFPGEAGIDSDRAAGGSDLTIFALACLLTAIVVLIVVELYLR